MATKGICCVDGCDKPVSIVTTVMCLSHHRRLRQHGNPLAGIAPAGLPMRFIADNVSFDGDECLSWPFARNKNGYPRVFAPADSYLAHRVMCRAAHGNPPAEKPVAAHSCGNGHKGCVNPRHLRWADHIENAADRIVHGTSNRGTNNGSAKISPETVRAIVAMRQSGKKIRQVASALGVSEAAVSSVTKGWTWSWLTGIVANDGRAKNL